MENGIFTGRNIIGARHGNQLLASYGAVIFENDVPSVQASVQILPYFFVNGSMCVVSDFYAFKCASIEMGQVGIFVIITGEYAHVAQRI
jgi:hypothetical protein